MKIIYITGKSAQGKSTFSKLLEGLHFEMDHMYCAYKRERDIMYEFDQSDWTTWNQYPDLEQYKITYYENIKKRRPKILIIDSVTTAIKKERDLIEKIFKPDEVKMFIIESLNHKEQYLNKFKHKPKTTGSVRYFNYKNKLFDKDLEPCEDTTIIRYEKYNSNNS
jgi:hypothetical protein